MEEPLSVPYVTQVHNVVCVEGGGGVEGPLSVPYSDTIVCVCVCARVCDCSCVCVRACVRGWVDECCVCVCCFVVML